MIFTPAQIEAAARAISQKRQYFNPTYDIWSLLTDDQRNLYKEMAEVALAAAETAAWQEASKVDESLKDGNPVLALIPCYGHYNEIGKLRGYLHAIVTWKYGQWNEVGVGKREPVYVRPLPPPPDPAEE